MATFYDSGWITGSSGSITAAVLMAGSSQARVIMAASGASGSVSASIGFTAGAQTTIPWSKTSPAFPVTPLVTGAYPGVTFVAPSTGTFVQYYFGSRIVPSGSVLVSPFVPDVMNVTLIPNTGSYWGRVVVEAHE